MRKEFECLKDMYLDEIKEITKHGTLTPQDGEAAYKALSAIEKIYKVHEWDEEETAEKMARENGYSERYGRTGNGYHISRMINKLEDMRDQAPDHYSRKTINRAITDLEDSGK